MPAVKVAKLKKRAAELEEDVFGLNIALDVCRHFFPTERDIAGQS